MSRLIYVFFMIIVLMAAISSNLQSIKYFKALEELKRILELDELDAIEEYILNKRIGVM